MMFEYVLQAWHDHHRELRHFMLGQLKDPDVCDDLLQDVFLKAMREGQSFCELENPRSWLFRVARNALIDAHRLRKTWVPVPEHLPDEGREPRDPVADLDVCIRAALPALGDDDRDILEACDLGRLSQADYASAQAISLPAAKARIRRARERLREELARRCDVVTDSSGRICCHSGGAASMC
ncbi:MAG: sigma-70 family RNA polymerase sigma factor [Marinobacter sp.]|uniref:sigma-70 family RNA polymerase sigma factor n=1 Tax=Marinobacter sp. TaxID=50741 RepID=UPI00349FD329